MFYRLILFESSLFLLAWILAWAMGIPWLGNGPWNWHGWVLGITSILPMISMYLWLLQSRWEPCREMRCMMKETVLPIFKHCSCLQLALLSGVAGISEEVLFRGLIQGGLQPGLGTPLAILISATLFGACHALSRFYFLLATLIGVYMSLLYLATDQLLSPIVAHAGYDFFVLMHYLKRP